MAFQYTHDLLEDVAPVDALRSEVRGEVLTRDDSGYEQAVATFNTLSVQHPAVVLIAENAADVVAGVRFAREQGLAVAVQATGHGTRRIADEESLLISTARMNNFRINATARMAWIEGGTKWGPVLAEAQKVGLAPLLGSSPDVGVVGYTLGGGLGWIGRKYGLSADHVRFIDIVTPDGQLRRASETENSDLFWALRGGGANFGVVTAIEVELFPVTEVYAGNLYYPAVLARDVFKRYSEWVKTLPDEFTTSVSLLNMPDLPFVPEPMRGQSFAIVRGAYTGDLSEGQKLIDSWRQWQAPAMDAFGPMPFSNAATISNDPTEPAGAYITSELFKELRDEAIDTVLKVGLAANGSPMTAIEFRHIGGAIRRPSPELNAIGIRSAEFITEFITITPTQAIFDAVKPFIVEAKRALKPFTTGGMYLNFTEWHENEARSRDSYSAEGFARVQAIKMKYDPENVFSYGVSLKNRA